MNTPQAKIFPTPIYFDVQTYSMFQEGLKKLVAQLKPLQKAKAIFDLDEDPLERDLGRLETMIKWGDEKLSEAGSRGAEIYTLSSHQSLRFLKAAGMLQIREYERKKSEYIRANKSIPKVLLQAIDEKLTQLKNLVEQGPLNGIDPSELIVELSSVDISITPSSGAIHTAQSAEPPIILVESDQIPIIDEQLRLRCLYLLRTIEDEKDETKLDTVVREMSVILEDRVRKVANISEKLTGVELMAEAFASTQPKLIFSAEPDVQSAAHLLFRGYIGFFRNEAMHKLITTYTRERVYQMLGYVDYLLFLLSQATRMLPPDKETKT